MDDETPHKDAGEASETPRRRGRPKGYPKLGGRTAGARNVTSAETRQEARDVLRHFGPRVLRRLAHIACGNKIRSGKQWVAPSETFQAMAMKTLVNKMLPDLAAQQLTGPNDSPLFPDSTPVDDHELAKWIAGKLTLADPEIEDSHTEEVAAQPTTDTATEAKLLTEAISDNRAPLWRQ